MRNRLTTLLAAATLVAGLTGTVFAQEHHAPAQPPASADQPADGMMHGQDMMGQHGDDMMKMMARMNEMMESCSKMMQAKAQPQGEGATPQKQGG